MPQTSPKKRDLLRHSRDEANAWAASTEARSLENHTRRRFLKVGTLVAAGVATSLLGLSYLTSRRQAAAGLVIQDVPRDAIPPLDSPSYIGASEATWLNEGQPVLGFENEGDARAYPPQIMNFHEIVNDQIGGKEVVVTFCPLTFTGIVYDAKLDASEHSFGNTGALFESNLVMYDRESGSNWWQVGGRAIEGPLKGSNLTRLPSLMTTWSQWKTLYPETRVLSKKTGFVRPYDVNLYSDYDVAGQPAFPVSVLDNRLPTNLTVLGLEVDGRAIAYPLSGANPSAITAAVNGKRVLIYLDPENGMGAAFQPLTGGTRLSFKTADGGFRDQETGSLWDAAGRAVDGSLKGMRLVQIPTVSGFWFAWVTLHPDTEIFDPQNIRADER